MYATDLQSDLQVSEGLLGDTQFTTLTALPERRVLLSASYLDAPRVIALPRADVVGCEELPAALAAAMAGVYMMAHQNTRCSQLALYPPRACTL